MRTASSVLENFCFFVFVMCERNEILWKLPILQKKTQTFLNLKFSEGVKHKPNTHYSRWTSQTKHRFLSMERLLRKREGRSLNQVDFCTRQKRKRFSMHTRITRQVQHTTRRRQAKNSTPSSTKLNITTQHTAQSKLLCFGFAGCTTRERERETVQKRA